MTNTNLLFAKLAIENQTMKLQKMIRLEMEPKIAEANKRKKFFAEKLALGWDANRVFNEWNKFKAGEKLK